MVVIGLGKDLVVRHQVVVVEDEAFDPQAGRHFEFLIRVPFVLGIKSLRPICGSTISYATWSLEPVVAIVIAHAESLTLGQREDTFSLNHRALLV